MKLNITVQLLIVLLKTYVYILTDRTVWKVSPKGFGEKSFVAWSQLCLWIKDEKITLLPFRESKSSKITGVFCSCVLRSSGMFSKLLETIQIAGGLNLAVSTFPNITIVKNGANHSHNHRINHIRVIREYDYLTVSLSCLLDGNLPNWNTATMLLQCLYLVNSLIIILLLKNLVSERFSFN